MAQLEPASDDDRLSRQDWAVLDDLLRHGALDVRRSRGRAVVGLAGSEAHLERLARAGLVMRLPGHRSATFLITAWGDLRWRQERRRRDHQRQRPLAGQM